jgi:hypothetical protein
MVAATHILHESGTDWLIPEFCIFEMNAISWIWHFLFHSKGEYMDWVALKSRITNHRLNSTTWASEQHSLLEIYNWAEEWGIDPTRAALAPLSN